MAVIRLALIANVISALAAARARSLAKVPGVGRELISRPAAAAPSRTACGRAASACPSSATTD